jgi:A/G-specific adenine glycosylase
MMDTKNIVQFREQLIQWYIKNHRQLPWRETDNPYHIWVSEVMLQQTRVKIVLLYYQKFLERFPDLRRLAHADLQSVLKIWQGMGYYARARNLHEAAKLALEKYNGNIPDNWDRLRELPGVGEYIAAAVLSFAFNQPYYVVEGNVKRVLARLFEIDAPVNRSFSLKIFREAAGKLFDSYQPGVFNQAIMELGAVICSPRNPECGICPVQSLCLSHQDQKVVDYPTRLPNKIIPEYHMAIGVIFKNNRILIGRRKKEGLLGGLWEFPGGKLKEKEDSRQACVREIKEAVNLTVEIHSFATRIKHAYTHFKIIMDVFWCKYLSGEIKLNGSADRFCWTTLKEIERYPFSIANYKIVRLLKRMAVS